DDHIPALLGQRSGQRRPCHDMPVIERNSGLPQCGHGEQEVIIAVLDDQHPRRLLRLSPCSSHWFSVHAALPLSQALCSTVCDSARRQKARGCWSCSAWALISSAVAASSSEAEAFCWVSWLSCSMAPLICTAPDDCSPEAAAISCTRSEVFWIAGTICPRRSPARSASATEEAATSSISWAATCARSASLRTSAATTAQPRPCSPARAASMAPLRASRLVW